MCNSGREITHARRTFEGIIEGMLEVGLRVDDGMYHDANLSIRTQAMKTCFIIPRHSNIGSAHALSGRIQKHENCTFLTQMLYYCLAMQTDVYSVDSQVILMLDSHVQSSPIFSRILSCG